MNKNSGKKRNNENAKKGFLMEWRMKGNKIVVKSN